MQLLVKVDEGAPVGAPILADNLRQVFPDLPDRFLLASDVLDLGYAPFVETPSPSVDDPTLKVIEIASTAQNSDGEWLQAWDLVDSGLSESEKIQALSGAMMEELASIRWRHEIGGTALPDGTPIRTDRHTQSKLTSAVVQMQAGVISEVRWKLASGFVSLDGPQITAIAGAVTVHVAACFEAEEVVGGQIAAASTVEAIRAIDVGLAFEAALNAALA